MLSGEAAEKLTALNNWWVDYWLTHSGIFFLVLVCFICMMVWNLKGEK